MFVCPMRCGGFLCLKVSMLIWQIGQGNVYFDVHYVDAKRKKKAARKKERVKRKMTESGLLSDAKDKAPVRSSGTWCNSQEPPKARKVKSRAAPNSVKTLAQPLCALPIQELNKEEDELLAVARVQLDKIIENEGGTKGSRDNRESAKAVWERALSFWSIPKRDWYSDDINHLRMFAAWSLRSPETVYESLRPFVALVNHCRGIGEPYLPKGTAPDNTRCWAYNPNVIRIRNAYAAVVEGNARERRNAVIPAITRSAGNSLMVNTSEGRKKKVLCAISEAVAMRMLKNGEKNLKKQNQVSPVIALVFVMTLFGVRASTIGDYMVDQTATPRVGSFASKDLYFSKEGLCYIIRFCKYWKGGKQGRRKLPLVRSGKSCVPWGDGGELSNHIRSRILRLIKSVLEQGRFWFLKPGDKEHTSAEISKFMTDLKLDNGDGDWLTSHAGHRTMSVVLPLIMCDPAVTTEWGLWGSDSSVKLYEEEGFKVSKLYADLFDFLKRRGSGDGYAKITYKKVPLKFRL